MAAIDSSPSKEADASEKVTKTGAATPGCEEKREIGGKQRGVGCPLGSFNNGGGGDIGACPRLVWVVGVG